MDKLSKLNKQLLIIPKMLYFALATTFYTFHQFRTQFIHEKFHTEKGALGFYLSIPQFISFFSSLYIGAVNDRFGKQKFLLLGLLVASALFFYTFFGKISEPVFWISYTFYFNLMAATLPLLDKVILDYVADIPEMGAKTFGSQRIWATFGYLFTNFTIEHFISTSDPKVQNFNKMQPFNIAATVVASLLVFAFVGNFSTQSNSSSNYFRSVKQLISNFEYMYFIFIIFLCGISRAFMTNYLGIYYSKVLKFQDQKNTLSLFWPLNKAADFGYNHKQSVSTLFGVALEILVFYNSSFITDKLGLLWPILLSQIFQFLRFLSYICISYDNPNSFALCCLTELLKGANYSLIHTSALQLANSFSPPHLRTTSQLIYTGTFVAIGTVFSGILFKGFFDPKAVEVKDVYAEYSYVFKINALFSLIGIAFFIGKYAIHENLLFSRANTERKLQAIESQANIEEEASKTQVN